MRKFIRVFSIPFFSFLLIPLQPDTRIHITPAQWQEDLAYFKEQMVKKHKNAFHHISEAEYISDIAKLNADIPGLKDYQVIVRLMMITAKIGDGHTGVHIPTDFKRYPIVVNWFGDELWITGATQGYKAALGKRILKFGNMPLADVSKKMAAVLSQAENKWYDMSTSTAFMMTPEIMVTLGIVPEYDHAILTVVDEQGIESQVDLSPITFVPGIPWISVSKTQPLFRQNQNDPFWFSYLEDIDAVFLSFKKYDNLHDNSDKLFDFIKEKNASRLIVDLRFNGGGDFKKGRRLLIEKIKDNKTINQKGNLFVITGRRTYSAAMVNSIDFKKETNAIIIGEPPGEVPNSYSENDEMKLPNSKLVISYSTRYYKFLDVDVPTFEPDIRIDPDWKNFLEGKDAVMDWIITSCKK